MILKAGNEDMMAPRARRQREGRYRHPRRQIGGGAEARARERQEGTKKFGSGDQLQEQPRCPVQSQVHCGNILFFSSLTLSQSSFKACLIAGSTFVWYFSRYDSSKFLNSFPSDITVPSLASSFITFVWRSAMIRRSSSTDYWLEKTLGFWAASRDVTCLLLQWGNLFVKSLCKLKIVGLHLKGEYFVQ